MKKLYRINWSTESVETATLLDEHNMNDGASVETWLCKDSNGRRFTCSKFDWQLSELAAWQEYEAELDENCKAVFQALLDAEKNHELACTAHLNARQRVLELTAKH